MSRGVITNANGEGHYNITRYYDTARATAEIARLQADNVAIDTRLGTLQTEINTARDDVYLAKSVLSAAIAAQEEEDGAENLKTASDDLKAKLAILANLESAKQSLRLRSAANTKRIAYLQDNLPANENTTAWCADYNDLLSGEVGLIEVGREGAPPIIRPAGVDGDLAAYNATDDGALVPVISNSPAGAFYNLAMLPAVNKWRPRFRTGTASAINLVDDTMTVTLDNTDSIGLDINQATVLNNVPVEYMSCNATAFTDGDAVLVSFNLNWSTPKVIGFVSNPVNCCEDGTVVLTGSDAPVAGSIYTATGGTEPYTFSITPSGAIDPETGEILSLTGGCGSGLVQVRDAVGCRAEIIIRYPLGSWSDFRKLINPYSGYQDTYFRDCSNTIIDTVNAMAYAAAGGYPDPIIVGDVKISFSEYRSIPEGAAPYYDDLAIYGYGWLSTECIEQIITPWEELTSAFFAAFPDIDCGELDCGGGTVKQFWARMYEVILSTWTDCDGCD